MVDDKTREKEVKAWEDFMVRAFKGIGPSRRQRRKNLQRALKRHEAKP